MALNNNGAATPIPGPNATTIPIPPTNTTWASIPANKDIHDDFSTSQIMTYIFVPIGVLLVVVMLAALVVFLLKKTRLDKLRHHLMPLYNFDPAEEGEDWESELLGDGADQRLAGPLKSPSPTDNPKLAFATDLPPMSSL